MKLKQFVYDKLVEFLPADILSHVLLPYVCGDKPPNNLPRAKWRRDKMGKRFFFSPPFKRTS